MAHSVVLRFKSMTPSQLGAVAMHGRREGGDLGHIDPSRTASNEVLIGGDDWAETVRAEVDLAKAQNLREECQALEAKGRKKDLADRRRRGMEDPWKASKEGPIREAILSAKSDHFVDEGFRDFGDWDDAKVEAFKQRGRAFFEEHFPGQVAHLRLDRDEEAPHLHAVLVPWHEKTSARRGAQRTIQPSSNALLADYEKAQDRAGEWFADLGLRRGERRAEKRREALAANQPPPENVRHTSPAQWRADQAERLERDIERAGRKEAQATAKMDAAEKRECEVAAFERGVEAMDHDELAFRPRDPKAGKKDRLIYGEQAPSDRSERAKLVEAVKPAYGRLVALGRRIWSMGQRARERATDGLSEREKAVEAREAETASLGERETAVAERERQVGQDAGVVHAARERARQPRDEALAEVAARRRRKPGEVGDDPR